MLAGACFFQDRVPCFLDNPHQGRPMLRKAWLDRARETVSGCSLVFLDPDNGIASENLRPTLAVAGKSVFVDELTAFMEPGRTLIVYHYQTRRRGGHQLEIRDLMRLLKGHGLPVLGTLRAKPYSPRAFFFLGNNPAILQCAQNMPELWGKNFEWYPG